MRISTCPWVAMLTTAGVTFSSMGARLGMGLPSIAAGKSAWAPRTAANSSTRTTVAPASQASVLRGQGFTITAERPRRSPFIRFFS